MFLWAEKSILDALLEALVIVNGVRGPFGPVLCHHSRLYPMKDRGWYTSSYCSLQSSGLSADAHILARTLSNIFHFIIVVISWWPFRYCRNTLFEGPRKSSFLLARSAAGHSMDVPLLVFDLIHGGFHSGKYSTPKNLKLSTCHLPSFFSHRDLLSFTGDPRWDIMNLNASTTSSDNRLFPNKIPSSIYAMIFVPHRALRSLRAPFIRHNLAPWGLVVAFIPPDWTYPFAKLNIVSGHYASRAEPDFIAPDYYA